MTKCKNPSCTNEVVSIEGRRPKEFCSVECRTKFHNSKNKKEGSKRGRPAGAKNKSTVVGAVPLPKDYVSFTEVAVLNEDGSTTPLNEIAGMGGGNKVVSDAINELLTFGTTTVKTELVDGKAKQSVVDKKKIVNEDAEWKPKLSPFMLSRQKTKGGGQ